MTVSNINALSGSASTGSSASSAATVDYQQFLRLLVAELKNQDPTSPTDPTQFMSQLASFSAVEQQVRTNSTLDALLSAQATNLIGKTVTSTDGLISGAVASVTTAAGGDVKATLTDGRTLSVGAGSTVRNS